MFYTSWDLVFLEKGLFLSRMNYFSPFRVATLNAHKRPKINSLEHLRRNREGATNPILGKKKKFPLFST